MAHHSMDTKTVEAPSSTTARERFKAAAAVVEAEQELLEARAQVEIKNKYCAETQKRLVDAKATIVTATAKAEHALKQVDRAVAEKNACEACEARARKSRQDALNRVSAAERTLTAAYKRLRSAEEADHRSTSLRRRASNSNIININSSNVEAQDNCSTHKQDGLIDTDTRPGRLKVPVTPILSTEIVSDPLLRPSLSAPQMKKHNNIPDSARVSPAVTAPPKVKLSTTCAQRKSLSNPFLISDSQRRSLNNSLEWPCAQRKSPINTQCLHALRRSPSNTSQCRQKSSEQGRSAIRSRSSRLSRNASLSTTFSGKAISAPSKGKLRKAPKPSAVKSSVYSSRLDQKKELTEGNRTINLKPKSKQSQYFVQGDQQQEISDTNIPMSTNLQSSPTTPSTPTELRLMSQKNDSRCKEVFSTATSPVAVLSSPVFTTPLSTPLTTELKKLSKNVCSVSALTPTTRTSASPITELSKKQSSFDLAHSEPSLGNADILPSPASPSVELGRTVENRKSANLLQTGSQPGDSNVSSPEEDRTTFPKKRGKASASKAFEVTLTSSPDDFTPPTPVWNDRISTEPLTSESTLKHTYLTITPQVMKVAQSDAASDSPHVPSSNTDTETKEPTTKALPVASLELNANDISCFKDESDEYESNLRTLDLAAGTSSGKGQRDNDEDKLQSEILDINDCQTATKTALKTKHPPLVQIIALKKGSLSSQSESGLVNVNLEDPSAQSHLMKQVKFSDHLQFARLSPDIDSYLSEPESGLMQFYDSSQEEMKRISLTDDLLESFAGSSARDAAKTMEILAPDGMVDCVRDSQILLDRSSSADFVCYSRTSSMSDNADRWAEETGQQETLEDTSASFVLCKTPLENNLQQQRAQVMGSPTETTSDSKNSHGARQAFAPSEMERTLGLPGDHKHTVKTRTAPAKICHAHKAKLGAFVKSGVSRAAHVARRCASSGLRVRKAQSTDRTRHLQNDSTASGADQRERHDSNKTESCASKGEKAAAKAQSAASLEQDLSQGRNSNETTSSYTRRQMEILDKRLLQKFFLAKGKKAKKP